LPQAIGDIEAAIPHGTEDEIPQLLRFLGHALYEAGNFVGAIEVFHKVIALKPNDRIYFL
jgi:Flp pilus assembly protein TadD